MATLKEALDIKRGEIISLVGAGGKTSLMYALARELSSHGKVITTTTTKIRESETGILIIEPDEGRMIGEVRRQLNSYNHITVVRERLSSGKLAGISPEAVIKLAGLGLAYAIVVEADGAAGRSLKAPIEKEPVIPGSASLVIPVAGIDAVGCPLTGQYVFRTETVARLLGISQGSVISAENIAFLMTRSMGIIKGSPPGARIVPFINKMDLSGALAKGRDLAGKILSAGHPQIDRVVLGQARLPEPVAEVIFA